MEMTGWMCCIIYWYIFGAFTWQVLVEARPVPRVHTWNRSLNLGSTLEPSLVLVEHRIAVLNLISFSHDHLTLVLQRSVRADIEAPIERTRIPNCSCERILVLGVGRLISVPGPAPICHILNLACERQMLKEYELIDHEL